MTNCKDCRSHLPDLLLDEVTASQHPELAAHLAACAECRTELDELRSTFALLGAWEAPEPSPFFDSKLHARLREAVAAEPEGFWERTRSFLLFSTGRQFRPAVAGALALVLMIGGGTTFLSLRNPAVDPTASASATVNDLRILDNNAQALQQMDQLLDESAPNTDDGSGPPTT